MTHKRMQTRKAALHLNPLTQKDSSQSILGHMWVRTKSCTQNGLSHVDHGASDTEDIGGLNCVFYLGVRIC